MRRSRTRRRARWLFRRLSRRRSRSQDGHRRALPHPRRRVPECWLHPVESVAAHCRREDRKSTRLNSSHVRISYAVFCFRHHRDLHSFPTRRSSDLGDADVECDVLVLGAGPGGYSAAFRAADLGLKTVIVERYPTLGGVCLNVGCIPSKALLHIAGVMDEVSHFADLGVAYGQPKLDIDKLRTHKEKVVGKLTGGLAGMAKGRKVEVVRGTGSFLDPQHVEVQLTSGEGKDVSGEKKVVKFKQCIIAAGSQAIKLPFMPDDPRVVDSTGALELASGPKKMLVIGGGIIGLEMATVYSTLGARIDVVEMQDGLMQGADRDLVKVWEKMNAHRFDNVMLKTKTVSAEAKKDGIWVKFEGEKAPADAQCYDLVLVAVGRSPNGDKIGADKAGVTITEQGFIPTDNQMRTNE